MAYFALDFSKSKIECRRVCFLHFRCFAILKSGIIRLTDLITYLFIDVNHEFATAKRKTRQCTSYWERKPTFQREGVHPPLYTNTVWSFSSMLQLGEILSVPTGNFDQMLKSKYKGCLM